MKGSDTREATLDVRMFHDIPPSTADMLAMRLWSGAGPTCDARFGEGTASIGGCIFPGFVQHLGPVKAG
jgi:hypothetical protein